MKWWKLRFYAQRCPSDGTSTTCHERLARREALDQTAGVAWMTVELRQSRNRERAALFKVTDLLRCNLQDLCRVIKRKGKGFPDRVDDHCLVGSLGFLVGPDPGFIPFFGRFCSHVVPTFWVEVYRSPGGNRSRSSPIGSIARRTKSRGGSLRPRRCFHDRPPGRFSHGVVVNTSTIDPLAYGAASCALVVAATVATLLPAVRAAYQQSSGTLRDY